MILSVFYGGWGGLILMPSVSRLLWQKISNRVYGDSTIGKPIFHNQGNESYVKPYHHNLRILSWLTFLPATRPPAGSW